MSRVRAVEHGRAVVVAATSGVSAMVQPDGSVTQRTGMFVPAALVERLPLRGQTTLATRLGAWPEWVMSALGRSDSTWASDGLWAPSGDYSRFVSPIIGIVWILVCSRVLLARRSPSTTPQAPEPPAVPAQ